MGLLSKDQVLQSGDKLKQEKVIIDQSNDEYVYVREMTGHERSKWEESMFVPVRDKKGNIIDYQRDISDMKAKLAVCTVCDENGDLLFGFDDYKQLSKKMSAGKLEKIVNVAYKLSGITEEDREEMVKNSEGGQSDNSISDSAAN